MKSASYSVGQDLSPYRGHGGHRNILKITLGKKVAFCGLNVFVFGGCVWLAGYLLMRLSLIW